MTTRQLKKPSLLAVCAAATALAACHPPPDLPPADSMTFFEFQKGKPSAMAAGASETAPATAPLTQALDVVAGPTINVDLAALSVGLVSAGVNLALLWPRLFFAGALTARAQESGGVWTWDKTFALAGWRAVLTGKLENSLKLEMHVTGLRGTAVEYQNFLWYTGDHHVDRGVWTVFAKPFTGPVMTIDWSRRSASDKDVTFTNVTQTVPAVPELGDRLAYTLRGNVATMAIHDALTAAGVPGDFSVTWDIVEGEGQMKRGAESFCWETLAKGQVDMPCPATPWPTP